MGSNWHSNLYYYLHSFYDNILHYYYIENRKGYKAHLFQGRLDYIDYTRKEEAPEEGTEAETEQPEIAAVSEAVAEKPAKTKAKAKTAAPKAEAETAEGEVEKPKRTRKKKSEE